jgi:hypothetical protein
MAEAMPLERFSSFRGVSRNTQDGFFLRKKPFQGITFPLHQLENRYKQNRVRQQKGPHRCGPFWFQIDSACLT